MATTVWLARNDDLQMSRKAYITSPRIVLKAGIASCMREAKLQTSNPRTAESA